MKISFIGDIMVTEDQLKMYQNAENNFDFSYAFKNLKSDFKDSDYVIANLETPIAGEEFKYTDSEYSFNAPCDLLKALKDIGVNIVQTSNNHCLDRGIEGLKNTIYNIQNAGLINIGTHLYKDEPYKIINKDNIDAGILAYTYGTNAFINNYYLNKDQRYMIDLFQRQELSNPITRKIIKSKCFIIKCFRFFIIRILKLKNWKCQVYERKENSKKELKNLKSAIEKCRENADFVVLCLHIGGQYNSEPTEYTKNICRLCEEWGANAIIANHEHVIQNICRNISSKSFCEYSLGNFFSSTGVTTPPFDRLCNYSAVYNINIDKSIFHDIKFLYSVSLYINYLDHNNKIIIESVYSYYKKLTEDKRKQIYIDSNILLNRIFNTKNINYEIQREYIINL